jgi:hypothetical protein
MPPGTGGSKPVGAVSDIVIVEVEDWDEGKQKAQACNPRVRVQTTPVWEICRLFHPQPSNHITIELSCAAKTRHGPSKTAMPHGNPFRKVVWLSFRGLFCPEPLRVSGVRIFSSD